MTSVVLIVDDEPAARYGMRRALEKEGYTVVEADNIGSAERSVESHKPSAVVLDVKLTNESGLDYLPNLISRPEAPSVIIVTAHGNERTAVDAIKRGAYDYLSKPFEVEDLRILVRNAVELFQLRADNQRLRNELTETQVTGDLIGSSTAIKVIYNLIDKVAQTDATVLIIGESGTGKELVAKEIHRRSERSGSFVALNCAALPGELIESEMFGHEKGAFTGAITRRIGKIEASRLGTLFLDEIGDMSLSTQAKLLRVLEAKKFQRLGSNEDLVADIRIISATNKNLKEEIESHRFREDLYYRLCVVSINVPPLRDRRSDIPALAQAFCTRYSLAYKGKPLGIASNCFKVLLEYRWPGNVRELRNCIERCVVLAENEEITLDILPDEIKWTASSVTGATKTGQESLLIPMSLDFRAARREFERLYIEKCLELNGGNITQAASTLGMHRQSLQHKIKELGLTRRFVSK